MKMAYKLEYVICMLQQLILDRLFQATDNIASWFKVCRLLI